MIHQPGKVFGSSRAIRLVDGTRIKEPGPTGSSWCIHYAIDLPSLRCQELEVCDKHGSGESFSRFRISPGDVFVGDRVYGARPGIYHVVDGGGDVLVRFPITNLPLYNSRGGRFNLLSHLRKLKGMQVEQWAVMLPWKDRQLHGRICAIKKSRQAMEKAQKHLRRQSQKCGTKPAPETEEAAGYIFVFTTCGEEELTPTAALEMYRGRWQIELVFKRLKSILDLGHLHKTDEDGAKAWIQGKLFVALLIETLLRQAEIFFPWGYPLRKASSP
ncbi:transposase [bacterium]|nr:transposase [bacterium]